MTRSIGFVALSAGLALLAGCTQPTGPGIYGPYFYGQPGYQPAYPVPQYGTQSGAPLPLLPPAPQAPSSQPLSLLPASPPDVTPTPLSPPADVTPAPAPPPDVTPAPTAATPDTATPAPAAATPQVVKPPVSDASGGNVPLEGFRPMRSQTKPTP